MALAALATVTRDLSRNAESQVPFQGPELLASMLKFGKHCHKMLYKLPHYLVPLTPKPEESSLWGWGKGEKDKCLETC